MRIFLLYIWFASLLGFPLVVPSTASACTCYDLADGVAESITDYCQDLCGESTATEYEDGVCLCSSTTKTTTCVAVCEDVGMSAEPPSSDTSTSINISSKLLAPVLSIDIPTVKFSDVLFREEEGRRYLSINYLGDYLAGVYTYLLGISMTIAIVMFMVAGLQWTFGGTSKEAIGKAQARIKNAVIGLILILSTYVILFTVNPNLVSLQFPELEIIEAEGINEAEDESVKGTVATSFQTPSSSNVYGAAKNLVPEELVSDIEAVAKDMESQGYGLTITSGYRSLEEQKRQIALKCNNPPGSATCDPKDGKTTACILRDNNPANCPHTTGRALDIWGTQLGSSAQCITQPQCQPSLGANDPCRLNECQAALIAAMKEQGFCNLSSEAWHFEKPKMSTKCN